MGTFKHAVRIGSIVVGLAALSTVDPCLAQTSSDTSTKQAARTLANSVCAQCHGAEGRSTDPAVPRIAGQQRAYLEVQLKAFATHQRSDPEAHTYMWGITSAWLNDQLMLEIADYFSSQSPAPGKSGDPAAVAMGRRLFEKGSPDRSIPACAGCHGDNAEGMHVFPRLAAQHAQYLTRQMQMLRVRLRDSPVMHGVVRNLNDEEIVALATYLQSK
jgi:cytochrome c553